MPATSPTTACSAMSPSCASKAGLLGRTARQPGRHAGPAHRQPAPGRRPVRQRRPAASARAGGREARFRGIETQASDAHLQRIKAGEVDAAEVGALYLDILRDMKGINSHLVGAAAYRCWPATASCCRADCESLKGRPAPSATRSPQGRRCGPEGSAPPRALRAPLRGAAADRRSRLRAAPLWAFLPVGYWRWFWNQSSMRRQPSWAAWAL